MDDNELLNLTVVELKSLCSDRGLSVTKLRKKEIVELLVENGVSEIPAEFRNRLSPRRKKFTPRKSIGRFRRGTLTPQKTELNGSDLEMTTTRSSRYSRFLQLANQREQDEEQKLNANKENQQFESEPLALSDGKPPEVADESSEDDTRCQIIDTSEHRITEKEKPEASIEGENLKENEESASSSRTLVRRETFTVQTAASKSTKGVVKASHVNFKANRTPNFKKIHARAQDKFENIAEYSARKRDRMKQLLSTTREMRLIGTASRNSAIAPKTPIRATKAVGRIETPASERKIFSNKVRSNRRFELLMKARGLPIDGGEPLEDN